MTKMRHKHFDNMHNFEEMSWCARSLSLFPLNLQSISAHWNGQAAKHVIARIFTILARFWKKNYTVEFVFLPLSMDIECLHGENVLTLTQIERKRKRKTKRKRKRAWKKCCFKMDFFESPYTHFEIETEESKSAMN